MSYRCLLPRPLCLSLALLGLAGSTALADDPPRDDAEKPSESAPAEAAHDPFARNNASRPDDPFATPRKGADGNPFDRAGESSHEKKNASAMGALKSKSVQRSDGESAPAEQRIRRSLGEKTTVNFIDTPLVDVARHLSEMHQLPIMIDRRSLEEIGLTYDVPVTLNVSDISLRSALRLLLSDMDLIAVVRDEVVAITTMDNAASRLETKVYGLDKVGVRAGSAAALLMRTVQPGTWENSGGASTVVALSSPKTGRDLLVVSAPAHVHSEIQTLFDQLAGLDIEQAEVVPPRAQGASSDQGSSGAVMGGFQ